MAGERYPHLYLTAPPERQGFTSVQTRGGEPHFPDRPRREHAIRIAASLEAAWRTAGARQAVRHAERHGNYLEFAGAPGFDLALDSLEARRSGVRLLNVRVEGEGDQARVLATVYVPNNRRGYFLRKVSAFASEETRKGKPKNAPLVQSIDDVRAALLEAFWTDPLKPLPGAQPEWVEVWLSTDADEVVQQFRDLSRQLGLTEHEDRPLLRFPERTVLLLLASRDQLAQLIEFSDDIAELRAAAGAVSFYIELENQDQLQLAQELERRMVVAPGSGVAVCILDHGVNNAHPLLRRVLSDADLHTVHPAWGTHDQHGHGTLMAGVAAFGDLQAALQSRNPVHVAHVLESAKILPPPPAQNPKHLWGHVTSQGISRAEIQAPARQRVICMAVTAEDVQDRGRPTSWSAELDALASGLNNDRPRLILVSAGNVKDPADWRNYHHANLTRQVHDPAQAWNALTVGCCTFKTRIDDATLAGYQPVAPSGALSPFSTTSATWPHSIWPIKPEIVFEGGNVAAGPGGVVFDTDDLKLISTYRDPTVAHFAPFEGTSAAAAQAAWMSAQIQLQYPQAWPETIRALLVHSAAWTDAMQAMFLGGGGKSGYQMLLRTCGYGVPALTCALYCMRNALTLVSQAELQPFHKKDNGGYATRDMHLYRLPWPKEVLLDLGETPVSMRVTLSYFVEPGPGEIGWKDRYRYPSHGLRFELNAPGESEREFTRRINRQQRDEEEGHPATEAPNDHWSLGQQRNVGSIHSDIWSGTAADLASSHLVAIRPSIGWWRERHHLGRWNRRCRYSLVVSINTPTEAMDVYTPVAIDLGIRTPVPVVIPVS
ncbi:S8 family peptidase [bacterium]|nr:S8 family peptidase [bacterium]